MNRRAATLIEILVAIGLMCCLFGIGWAISSSFLHVKKARNYEIAIYLANQAMEAVRAARFREIGSTSEARKDTLVQDFSSSKNIYDESGEGFLPVFKVGNIEFTREVRVEEVPSLKKDFPSGLKLVQVVVQWKAPEDGAALVYEAISTVAE